MTPALPPGIETHDASDRDTWLRLRERDVTASVAGVVVGARHYMTFWELWALKSKKIESASDDEPTVTDASISFPPLLRGHILEPVAIDALRKMKPFWSISHPGRYYRDPAARIGATPDAFAVNPEIAGFGIVQIKTVEPSIFRKSWRQDDGSVVCPDWVGIQALIEAELTGASWAVVVAMVVGFNIDLHVVEVPLHRPLMELLRTEVREFWRRVEEDDAPDPDFKRDGAAIAGLYRQDDGSTVDLTGDNRVQAMSDEDSVLATEIKDRESRRKELKAELLTKIGEAATATFDGRVIATAKTVHRKEYFAKASIYRDIRFKRSA